MNKIAHLPCVEGAELSFMYLKSGNDIVCRNDNVNIGRMRPPYFFYLIFIKNYDIIYLEE